MGIREGEAEATVHPLFSQAPTSCLEVRDITFLPLHPGWGIRSPHGQLCDLGLSLAHKIKPDRLYVLWKSFEHKNGKLVIIVGHTCNVRILGGRG